MKLFNKPWLDEAEMNELRVSDLYDWIDGD
jgi:hypothetical protein